MGDASKTFRVGLAMAGAVSAGAYSAGALDFLIEALDAWYDAKARGENVPRHDIALDVAAGASAGAMCAALLAVALPYEFPHARLDAQRRPGAAAGANPFYRAWVEDTDIRPMLETGDLASGTLAALLDCTSLDAILQRSLDYSAPRRQRDYVSRPFVARFSLANLRGVPYDISYRGLRPASDTAYAHADYQGFLVGGAAPEPLPPHLHGHAQVGEAIASSASPQWSRLGQAALASGAFPFFLKPRLLSRPGSDYAGLYCGEPQAGRTDGALLPPVWQDGVAPPTYDYLCMDGGIFNNEPLALAREIVAGGYGRSLPHDGTQASGAVLMIAPFVARPGDGEELPLNPLHKLIVPLLFSFVAQCRFSPMDLALAHDETVYSRFLIAPYGSNSPAAAPYWIAGGPLQGFFGFFHREFRKHDYQLGRRNCQHFLRRHFRLPQDNTIVAYGYAQVPPEQRRAWLDADGELPIVPLLGAVAEEEPLCEWPAGAFDVAEVMDAVAARADAVSRLLRANLAAGGSNWFARRAIKAFAAAGWLGLRGQLLDGIRSAIDGARKAQRL